MNLFIYGGIAIFILFIVILFVNPNLSCFGKRLKSPFYPLLRKRRMRKKTKEAPTEDYGFSLVEEGERRRQRIHKVELKKRRAGKEKKIETEDYGFSLLGEDEKKEKK